MSAALVPATRVGGNMIRLSLAFFYNMGAAMRPVAQLEGGATLGPAWAMLITAQRALEDLLGSEWFSPAVRAAALPAAELHRTIKAITDRNDFDAEIGLIQVANLAVSVSSFETVLRTELHIADAYFVTRKAGYDTSILVQNAEQHFPQLLGVRVPTAIVDIREAGRCLAFELPTASGFHMFRAVESVVRIYWHVVKGKVPNPSLKTLGTYVFQMEKHSLGDKKVLSTLKQLKDLHRNPIAHPQVTLSVEEAVSLFGLGHSAIAAMLKFIPDPSP